jgi:hypothetical protein
MLPAMTARELPLLLCCAAWLRLSPPKAWVCQLLVVLHRCMDRATPKARRCTPQGLALSAWALTRLGMRMGPHFEVRWQDRVLEQLPSSCPQAVALQMYSLAALKRAPSPALMAAWLARSQQHMGQANAQDVASMLWALAKLRCAPGRAGGRVRGAATPGIHSCTLAVARSRHPLHAVEPEQQSGCSTPGPPSSRPYPPHPAPP